MKDAIKATDTSADGFRFHLRCERGEISVEVPSDKGEQLIVDAVMLWKRSPGAAFLHDFAIKRISEYLVAARRPRTLKRRHVTYDYTVRYGILLISMAAFMGNDQAFAVFVDLLLKQRGDFSIFLNKDCIDAEHEDRNGTSTSIVCPLNRDSQGDQMLHSPLNH